MQLKDGDNYQGESLVFVNMIHLCTKLKYHESLVENVFSMEIMTLLCNFYLNNFTNLLINDKKIKLNFLSLKFFKK